MYTPLRYAAINGRIICILISRKREKSQNTKEKRKK
jgi:hypothetical protein